MRRFPGGHLRYPFVSRETVGSDMGFLDDLKRQAESLQSEQQQGGANAQRNTMLAEAAATNAYRYLMELSKQLEVIKPHAHARYTLDKRTSFDRLPLVDFRFDARRKIVGDKEVLDTIGFACTARSGQKLVISKDFVNDIEQLEGRLRQGGVHFQAEPVRNPGTGKLIEMIYTINADFRVSLSITPLHERAVLKFSLHNLDGLETVECEFPAHEVSQARLDELARWWVGQPHRFLDGAQALRRQEPR
jgi:hypothetical protein